MKIYNSCIQFEAAVFTCSPSWHISWNTAFSLGFILAGTVLETCARCNSNHAILDKMGNNANVLCLHLFFANKNIC